MLPLDGWRAASILLVLAAHSGLPGVPGGLGVTIFFFVSGFLITGQLAGEHRQSGRIDLVAFYRRRFYRLVPASSVFVLVAGLFYVASGGTFRPLAWLGALFYVANYMQLTSHLFDTAVHGVVHPFVILWSLAIEEQFYLVWPLLLIAVGGCRRPVPLTAALACIVFCLVWRLHLAPICGPAHGLACGPHGDDWIAKSTVTRADSLGFGALAALSPRLRELGRRRSLVFGAALLLGATLLVRDGVFRETWRYTLQGCALVVLVPASLRARSLMGVALSRPAPVAIGRLSYGLYLWHWLALMVVERFGAGRVASFVLFAAVTALLTLASWVTIERPMIRLRRRAGSHAPDRLLERAEGAAAVGAHAIAR